MIIIINTRPIVLTTFQSQTPYMHRIFKLIQNLYFLFLLHILLLCAQFCMFLLLLFCFIPLLRQFVSFIIYLHAGLTIISTNNKKSCVFALQCSVLYNQITDSVVGTRST